MSEQKTKEMHQYDGLIVITAADLERVKVLLPRMRAHLPIRKLIFIGNEDVGEMVASFENDEYSFVNENDIIKFSEVEALLKKRLKKEDVPRGITGWYYQQFLKMSYSTMCDDRYYLVWDGDTIPCKNFSMFSSETGRPVFDIKNEYTEEYFITMKKLLPMSRKVIEKSFVSEHMLIDKELMHKLILSIEANDEIEGSLYYEKIMNSIRQEKICDPSFSEFETYGTFVALTDPYAYRLRDWHSLRCGCFFFIPAEMTEDDFAWLGQDFDAISFEKAEEYQQDLADIFHNSTYREKLRPRHIIQALYEEGTLSSNVVEKW